MAAVRQEADFEDGECSDSDDGDQNEMKTDPAPPAKSNSSWNMASAYRSRIPQILINSDVDSEDGSEEDEPSFVKRSKNRNKTSCQDASMDSGCRDPSQPFVNPILANESSSCGANGRPIRKNSVWGSVLTEQVLSQDIKGFGVDTFNPAIGGRDVESYDFRKAKEDDRPELDSDTLEVDSAKEDIFGQVVDLEGEVKKQERQKRKRKAKDRLGKRSYNKHKARDIKVTEESEPADVVKAITGALNEQNMELFTRIVETVGCGLALKVFHMTEDVEDAGGMFTYDGYRRRTAGGVYIQLLKTDNLATKEQLDHIFAADQLKWQERKKEMRKIKKATRKQWKKQGKRQTMDLDRPSTPPSPHSPSHHEDLEVLNVLEGHEDDNDFDAADLPERPATPEPKDDSSDGEDDEEEDDISVAIAKAKAAILNRQRQLANVSGQDESSEMRDEQGGDSRDMDDA